LAWPLFQIAAALGFASVIVWRLIYHLWKSAEIYHFLRVALAGLLFFLLGFSWHVYWGRSGLNARLPSALEGKEISVKGTVISLPRATEFGIQYHFQIEESDFGFTGKVLLNDYGVDAGIIRAGQRRNMQVRMKRPHGVANPGGFDREASLLRKGLVATGYVRIVSSVTEATGISLLTLRQSLLDSLNPYTSQSEAGGLVIALVLGVADQIDREQGELFSNTGTSHLFVISGLHVGLVAAMVYWLAGLCLRSFTSLSFLLPRQKLATLLAMLAATFYAGLAGFTLPTLRAVVMSTVVMAVYLTGRKLPVLLRWLLALAAVLSLDPLAAVSQGFWFSFIAVAALLLLIDGSQRAQLSDSSFDGGAGEKGEGNEEEKGSEKTIRNEITKQNHRRRKFSHAMSTLHLLITSQLNVFAALFLPLLVWGLPVSMLSPLINLLAIPILGFVVVPLCLLFAILAGLGSTLAAPVFVIVEYLLECLVGGLQLIGHWDFGRMALFELNTLPTGFIPWAFAGVGLALQLYPVLGMTRWLGVPLLMPLLWPVPQISAAVLSVKVLDIGQGLSVLVRTKQHSLIYDTGNGRDSGFSAGRAIIAPALKAMGISELDMIVVSHGDTDHAGGLTGLLAVIPTKSIVASDDVKAQNRKVTDCHELGDWVWDDVEFSFLETAPIEGSSNNNSCVLQVRFGDSAVLLPGDVEKEAEYQLLSRYGANLQSTLLIAPHHGSKTSSSYPFLKTVKPEQAVFTVGYRNRFNHPAQEILQRYEALGITTYTTSATGMLSFEIRDGELGTSGKRFSRAAAFGDARAFRKAQPRYWRCP
jgi:competence protein ComEC